MPENTLGQNVIHEFKSANQKAYGERGVQNCVASPAPPAQIFRTFQAYDTAYNSSKPTIIGNAIPLPFAYAPGTYNPYQGPANPWILASDQRTLEYVPKSQANPNYLAASIVVS